ncbi:hypothetical protein E7T09_04545 [Deinococcus sp. KSM4-11]|uniref:hypothetical protein n=1 Tax=Deinococcus sp. KSM4-11 TaxID=2568654 RepID=UPI0010A36A31|nr:hypothetical protein [Deinococcus sp. KSM4-11]THF88480.1 hypothetical protein E7T09_04545 [Deinococcus sp. KSM4-11]
MSGTQVVRYGAGDKWVAREVTTTGYCNNAFFGTDPAVGTPKVCQILVPGGGLPVPLPASAPTPTPVVVPQPAPAPPPTPAPVVIGPTWMDNLVITRGGVYRGAWQSTDPFKPAVKLMTKEEVTLIGQTRSKGAHVQSGMDHTKLIAPDLFGLGLNPDVAGRNFGGFIDLQNFDMADLGNIEHDHTAGVYLRKWLGLATQAVTIRIRLYKGLNVEGRMSDGKGGYQQNFYRLQHLQFNDVKNVPRVLVEWLDLLDEEGKSYVEDKVNISSSSGTDDSPMEFRFIRGNGAHHGWDPGFDSPKYSGGVVIVDGMLGQNIWIHHCAAANSDNYSFANAGGHRNITIEDNRAAALGRWRDGRLSSVKGDASFYNRDYRRHDLYPGLPAYDVPSIRLRRNYSARSKPTPNNPAARWDYSLEAGLGTYSENTSYQPNNAAVPDSEVQKVLSWWEAQRYSAGVTIGHLGR